MLKPYKKNGYPVVFLHPETQAVLKSKTAKANYLLSLTANYAGYSKWQEIWRKQREMEGNSGMPMKLDARKSVHIDHLLMSEICGVCCTRHGPTAGKHWPIDIRCDVCWRWTHSSCTDAGRRVDRLEKSSVSRMREDNVEFVCAKCRETI